MTIKECYEALGGDYSEVLERMADPQMVEKFIALFLKDNSFDNLCTGIADEKRMESFCAAHTLKGVCQNLGLGDLLVPVDKLTEILRPEADEIPKEAMPVFEDVKCCYGETVKKIQAYLDTKEEQ